jgi:DNA-binding transcriptional MerR regulator/mannose-6-phosphate isomerase-like protein (cupin superfamily)
MARLAVGSRPAPATPLGAVGIEEAARLVGASPSALREWERQGLVRPVRTTGGARRYLADDVERLRRVRAWRTVDGLNAAAIRRLLDGTVPGAEPVVGGRHGSMAGEGTWNSRPTEGAAIDGHSVASLAAPTAEPSTAHPWPAGSQLRSIRRDCSLTLREAAARSGLSTSFISSLERGVTGASIATLRRLVEAYGRTVGELLTGPAPANGRLVRPAERRVLDAGRGIRIEDLFAGPTSLESQLFVLAPGASSDGYYRHVGEEFMFVLAGSLGVWLDDPNEFYRLEPGDALTFPSTVDHRIAALGQVETRVLWINTPPTF